jgi:hypothetical protein
MMSVKGGRRISLRHARATVGTTGRFRPTFGNLVSRLGA